MNFYFSYDRDWAELNGHLHFIENNGGGLGAALRELRTHQLETGFIRDGLDEVERFTYFNRENPAHFFRVQYNPKRALRFNGSGVEEAPSGISVLNDGCFLCRQNIGWQQEGRELGYEISAGGSYYFAWMNPFPLLPVHAVIATTDHVTQDWTHHPEGSAEPRRVIFDLVELAERMPGFIGFYNGVNAGASIPGHRHFQFFERPDDGPDFPLENAARELAPGATHAELETGYPLPVALWRGKGQSVARAAGAWIDYWAARNQTRIERLTGNLIVTCEPVVDEVCLYFVPRERAKGRAEGMSGFVGGLEVLGELVFSSPVEANLLSDGLVDFTYIERVLKSVHTPLYAD